jgi:hypothetical protein
VISAFGSAAQRYARGLGDLDAVVVEPGTIGAADPEVRRRRDTGRPFYGMVLLNDERAEFGYRHAEAILAQVADYDRRRYMIDALRAGALPINGARADSLWTADAALEGIVVEFFGLCDALLVRSYTEAAELYRIWARRFPRRPPPPMERILAQTSVPLVEHVRPVRPSVVVWAPHRPALGVALHLHGLVEFRGEVACITAGGPLPSRATARFLAPDDPGCAAVLACAAAVICVEPRDPSDAVAFARQGFGVVAPLASGAHEYAGDVLTWDPLDARFLHTLVAVAVTRPGSVRSEPPRPPRAPLVV